MFDEQKALRVVRFFERVLVHTKGKFARKPFSLIPWQYEVISDLFGTLDDETGLRQYREAYIEVGKKNGKSELAAGIALYCLAADGEPGAEVYSAAAAKDQAALVFRVAASMVEMSPILSEKLRVIRSTKVIVKRDDPDSFYKALSADGDVQDGINPHCVIADEVHRWKVAKALDLWEILKRGTIARSQPIMIGITTAGVQEESPLCWQKREYARRIRESVFEDPRFYGKVYAADPGDDWESEATWKKANPSLEEFGGYLSIESLRDEFRQAKNDPGQAFAFKRFHLNIWGAKEERAIEREEWAKCGAPLRSLVEQPCYAGLDLASKIDLTALTLVFPREDGTYDIKPFFWMPKERLRTAGLKDKVPYAAWARQGFIEVTDGNVIDHEAVKKKLRWCRECFDVREVAYDPWHATQLSIELSEEGFEMVPIRQGYQTLSEPTKKLIELVKQQSVRHENHPALKWNADCLDLQSDGNDNVRPVKPDRKKSDKRIDGMVAAIMALDRAIRNGSGRSVYEDRGVLEL